MQTLANSGERANGHSSLARQMNGVATSAGPVQRQSAEQSNVRVDQPVQRQLKNEIGGDAAPKKKAFLTYRMQEYASMHPQIAAMFSDDEAKIYVTVNLNEVDEAEDQETRCVFNKGRNRTLVQITLFVEKGVDRPESVDKNLLHELVLHAVPAYLSTLNALEDKKEPDFKNGDAKGFEALEAADHGSRIAWNNMAYMALMSEAEEHNIGLFGEVIKEVLNYEEELEMSEEASTKLTEIYANLDESKVYSVKEKRALYDLFAKVLS